MHSPLGSCMEAAVRYLERTQHASGSWSDFWVPVGSSDAWVTAYTGLALHAASTCPTLTATGRGLARELAETAALWLLRHRTAGAWGYNGRCAPDADSTAHALSLLARLARSVPEEAVLFLRSCEVAGAGFRTYRLCDSSHEWAQPCLDVTAAALRAFCDLGEIDQRELRNRWCEHFFASQDSSGMWPAYWWSGRGYCTALALELRTTAGQPPLARPVGNLPSDGAFDGACALLSGVYQGHERESGVMAQRLRTTQVADGGWKALPILRVPPGKERARPPLLVADSRRIFTTATVLRSLAHFANGVGGTAQTTVRAPSINQRVQFPGADRPLLPARSAIGASLDCLIEEAARTAGLEVGAAAMAREVFAELTRESLADPCPWPTRQLSSLAEGIPVELSATVGERAAGALRYSAEVGNPVLAPRERALSGLAAVSRVATQLGAAGAWKRARPAIEVVVNPALDVPDGLRFWVWAGVDHPGGVGGAVPRPPVVKLYLNLLHRELGEGRARIRSVFAALDVPCHDSTGAALDLLDTAGFPHQLGIGLSAGGALGLKVYYEVQGWQQPLVERLLPLAGLPSDTRRLCPEIPGLIRESLAAKCRSGVALRIDLDTGGISELSALTPFPTPFLAPAVTSVRVADWLVKEDFDPSAYEGLTSLLLPAWVACGERSARLHGLFARSLSRNSSRVTVYLRPCVTAPNETGV